MTSDVHYFGIRHHGPGCAKSLLDALTLLQPDCLLVEGPPEGNELLSFQADAALQPPVALLAYNTSDPAHAAFFPFAEFSPEWQALTFAQRNALPAQFIDLPQTIQLAMAEAASPDESLPPASTIPLPPEIEPVTPPSSQLLRHDPMGWMAEAAGYEDGESWWNHIVEERMDANDLFHAITEMMQALRAGYTPNPDDAETKRENLREAHMRKCIRDAQKANYQRIAVVCGAWHVPALMDKSATAKADQALLKNLPKVKTSSTWVPWTYRHLSFASGYRAGIESPGWYEHIWRYPAVQRPAAWLAKISQLLRAHDLECSSAQMIDAARMADTLAAFRGRAIPGLEELNEAVIATVCMGDATPLALIRRELIVSDRLGSVPEDAPAVALQKDLEQQQKTLRLKPEALEKSVNLDLREQNGLARSHLLHRLSLLGIQWGEKEKNRSLNNKGSFHETWRLQWRPEFSIAIVEASRWGSTVEQAAITKALYRAQHAQRLAELTQLLDQALLADIELALDGIIQSLTNMAALTGDSVQLLEAIPALAQAQRYGNVRKTRADLLQTVLEGLITRVCIGLNAACFSLNDDAAIKMRSCILAFDQSVRLFEHEEIQTLWKQTLWKIAPSIGKIHGLICGTASRILFDAEEKNELILSYMSQALSIGSAPMEAAAWFEGFMHQGGILLLHNQPLWHAVDQWLMSLSNDHLLHVLPLVRRTFATFSEHERMQLNAKAQHGMPYDASSSTANQAISPWNASRALLPLAYLQTLFASED